MRTLSAMLSIGTGASIGREGPMVQLAAWASAWLARIVPIPPEQRSAIMVCGIAAGIAAAYHAPVAGVVFVLELALGFFARHTVAPVLIASGTASALVYVMVDPKPLYATAPIAMVPSSIIFTVLASIVFGGIGWGFLLLIERSRTEFCAPALARAAAGPGRPAGGRAVGVRARGLGQRLQRGVARAGRHRHRGNGSRWCC